MATHRTRLLAALGALALVPAGLASCGAGGQSLSDACEIVNEGMRDITTSVADVSSYADEGDLDGVTELADEIGDDLDDLDEQVTNEEVADVYADLKSGLNGILEAAAAIAQIDRSADDASALLSEQTEAAAEAQTTFNEATGTFGDLCGYEG